MRQTHQHPFASGGAFSPNLKTPKAQMSFDASKSSLRAGLPPPIQRAEQRRQKALLHLPALLPLPLAVAFPPRIDRQGIGPPLRPTQHQYCVLLFHTRNLLGIDLSSKTWTGLLFFI
jgi:hypothetical protein